MGIVKQIISDHVQRKSLVALGLYLCVMALSAFVFTEFIDRDSLQKIVEKTGQLGIVLYAIIEMIYVTFTPLMNTIIFIVSGYLFGGHVGFVVNFISTVIGLFFIIFLVKRYGRTWLRRVVSTAIYDRFDKIVEKVGPITLLIVYVLPFTPDDELTYLVAAGPIGFKRFILPVVLGTVAKAGYSYIGDMGSRGVAIAIYFRIILLFTGLAAIGLQEYILAKRTVAKLV
ncbi:MAG: VTT domain-containing protein [Patescibacteria group bacterium]